MHSEIVFAVVNSWRMELSIISLDALEKLLDTLEISLIEELQNRGQTDRDNLLAGD